MEDNLRAASLWKGFKSGSEEAFETLYKEHYSSLYGYGLKLFSQPDQLDDHIQDLFLKLWKNRDNLGEVHSVKAYLFKSFRRISMNSVVLARKAEMRVENQSVNELSLSVEDMLIEKEAGREQKMRLQQSLRLLTKRQREIIYLKFYQGFSYEEIEEILQINYQTIRNCVYEAIKVLKRDLLYVTLT